MDPSSLSFSSFASQYPGYYAPAPSATNALYQNRAGDLHTPNIAMNTVNPLAAGLAGGDPTTIDMSQLQPQLHHHQQQQQQHFNNIDPFAQQPSFAPSTFIHHDPIYQHVDHASMDNINGHVNPSMGMVPNGNGVGGHMDHHQPIPGNEKSVFVFFSA